MKLSESKEVLCHRESLPSRERELKQTIESELKPVLQSLPSRERELKLPPFDTIVIQGTSLPSRERELKQNLFPMEAKKENVAPFTGA